MGSEETRERFDVNFSSSHSEEHGGSSEGRGEEVEKEEEREERQETDSMPAAEGLDIVKTVIEEASTSMQEKSGSIAGLDVESPILPQTTPIQSEVIVIFNDQSRILGFLFVNQMLTLLSSIFRFELPPNSQNSVRCPGMIFST